MIRIPGFHCHGPHSITGLGTEILQVTWGDQKIIFRKDGKNYTKNPSKSKPTYKESLIDDFKSAIYD